FRQQFAQVTNPPIDPLREAIVMSLETCLGRELSVFSETEEHAERIILSSPVLSPAKYRALMGVDPDRYAIGHYSLQYDPQEKNLKQAVHDLAARVAEGVRAGQVIIVLSDMGFRPGLLPIH